MKNFLAGTFRSIFFIVVADLVCAALWGWGTIRYFEDRFVAPKAPIAVVLMGDFDETGEGLGKETQRRLNHAFDLYNEGAVEYVLCVGGARPSRHIFGSELMRQYLIDVGMPEGAVFLEKKSYDSKTNWLAAYSIIQNYGWSKVVIVSSPFHLYRFRQILMEGPQRSLKIFLSPYSLENARPPATYFDMWLQVHYQWLAHYANILPEKTYQKVIHRIRAQ